MSVYHSKPDRFLERLVDIPDLKLSLNACCAGFELQAWRCKPFANHLMEWLPDYALAEEELSVSHGNMYVKMQQAAVRVYTSEKYKSRGEAGEIALHAICRDYFDTIPISPRVFYKSASNDVIKSFDMVHARFPNEDEVEIWLGESKLYTNSGKAISDAIKSIKLHLDQGFLTNQKLILGPQIPKTTLRYEELKSLFKSQSSLDLLLNSAVFVVGIMCNSVALQSANDMSAEYRNQIKSELEILGASLQASGLGNSIKLMLIYVPLGDKSSLVKAFDGRLKGLQ